MAEPAAHRTNTEELPSGIDAHQVKFTGDGGVYMGVWLVNLLLMIVTLGLYTPFARRRTVQYFYGHTLIAGSPLEFTASMRRMIFGFLLFFALYLGYQLAASTGQDTAVVLFMVGGLALAPLLWGSAMRFRLGATRWRGIRGRFAAGIGEVYRSSWPVLVTVGAWGLFMLVLRQTGPRSAIPWLVACAALLATVLCLIRLEYNYKSLFFSRLQFGSQAGRWKPVYADFVKISLAAIGFFVAVVAVVLVLLALVIGGSLWAISTDVLQKGSLAVVIGILVGLAMFIVLVLASGPARAYREARIFKLVWNNVGLSHIARFKCDLSVRRYVLLRLKNMLLSMITLGFYRPFALVSEWQMKTESVTLLVKGGLDQLVGQLSTEQSAVGDAIADAIGLDLVG